MDYISTLCTGCMFLGYVTLWRIKRSEIKKAEGIDVKVINKAKRPIQRYFSYLEKTMTIAIVIIIALHTFFKDQVGITSYIKEIDCLQYKIIGFLIAICGLTLCRIAQVTIGKSWRVGIDEDTKPGLITNGIYQYVRNPTYTGLYILSLGVFIVNPTFLYTAWIIIFYLMMEFQVRCEEEYLESVYGNEYIEYCKQTKRYIPIVY